MSTQNKTRGLVAEWVIAEIDEALTGLEEGRTT